ncbi:hypothetical protein PSEUDO8Z_10495 [Pseudomonas sp. 8Z]|nr:hypothetical protein PSEUDO8Z_10495 [Pseudomonas sp. 8Z]
MKRRSLGFDRYVSHHLAGYRGYGQQTKGTHPRTKGALLFAGGPPAGQEYPMGSLIALPRTIRLPIERGKGWATTPVRPLDQNAPNLKRTLCVYEPAFHELDGCVPSKRQGDTGRILNQIRTPFPELSVLLVW